MHLAARTDLHGGRPLPSERREVFVLRYLVDASARMAFTALALASAFVARRIVDRVVPGLGPVRAAALFA
jgi:hypothetical protein